MDSDIVLLMVAIFFLTIAVLLYQDDRADNSFARKLRTLRGAGIPKATPGARATSFGRLRRRELALKIEEMLDLSRWFGHVKAKQLLVQAGRRQPYAETLYVVSRFIISLFCGAIAAIYAWIVGASVSIVVLAAAFGMYVGLVFRDRQLKRAAKRRQEAIERAWPDFIDSAVICLLGGMAFEPALQRILKEMGKSPSPLFEELIILSTELALLPERATAFNNFAARTDVDEIRAASTVFIHSEQFGTPLADPLSNLAAEGRKIRKARAENAAERMAPMMTGLSILFFVPVTAVVALAPVAIRLTGGE